MRIYLILNIETIVPSRILVRKESTLKEVTKCIILLFKNSFQNLLSHYFSAFNSHLLQIVLECPKHFFLNWSRNQCFFRRFFVALTFFLIAKWGWNYFWTVQINLLIMKQFKLIYFPPLRTQFSQRGLNTGWPAIWKIVYVYIKTSITLLIVVFL